MKKGMLLVVFLIGLFVPSFVKAGSVSVTLSCPGSANVGSQIECKVNVTSDVMVNGLSGNYSLNGLSYVNFQPQNGFTTYSASGSGFAVGNNSGKNGTFTIGIITLKVDSAGSIQISNLDASDTEFNSYNAGVKSASVRLTSTNNSLTGLTISNGTLSPAFDPNITNYTAVVDAHNITINATKGDNYQKISGTGTQNLKYGSNTFKVVVTSESGSTKTYTLVITRPDNRSSNNYLKSLTIDKGSISFNKNTTKYAISVGSEVTSIKVTASVEDGKASLVSGFGSRNVNLNYGDNTILIKVKAENDSVKTYTINVNRKDDRSKNNYLKSLSISSGEITFDKEKLEYNTSVYYDVTNIKVDAVAEDSKAVVKINNVDLVVGDNTITIEVTSESQELRTYKINIKRLSEEEKMSDNNKISSINIFGHDIDFSNDVSEYNITLSEKESELLFNVVLEDEKASYAINGNKELEDGSVVTLVTVSESGIEAKYSFVVEKEKSNKLLSNMLLIIPSMVVGYGLGLGTIVVVKKARKRKNK